MQKGCEKKFVEKRKILANYERNYLVIRKINRNFATLFRGSCALFRFNRLINKDVGVRKVCEKKIVFRSLGADGEVLLKKK